MARVEPHQLEAFHDALLLEAANCLRADDTFMASSCVREQCAHACRILRENHNPVVPYSVIGRLLQVHRGQVQKEWKAWKDHENNLLSPGRPVVLDANKAQELIEWVETLWNQHQPPTQKQTRLFIAERWRIWIAKTTLQRTIQRIPRIRCCVTTPIEAERLRVSDEDILAWFMQLRESIDGAPPHFVFNMDEMGHQDYADARHKLCVIPSYVTEKAYYEVSRRGKRISLIACIAADGSYMRPALILTRSTYDDELLEFGLTSEKIDVYSQKHSYIDRDIFTDWLKDTVIPDLRKRRALHKYSGPAFLLLDNCSAHYGPDITALANQNNLHFLYIPPHSSHFLQCLDVSVFGITKRLIANINRVEKVNIQTEHMIRLVNGFLAAAVPTNIIKSFKNAGISIARTGRDIRCKVTPETVRLFNAQALFDRHSRFVEEEEEHEDDVARMDMEGYVANCLDVMSGEGEPKMKENEGEQ